jgi:hypothetical protein
MSDNISGSITRGVDPTKIVTFEFQGKMEEDKWTLLISRIRQLLQHPDFQAVKLVEAGDE